MADNSEELEKTEIADIEDAEVEEGGEIGGTDEETGGNLGMEGYLSGEGSFIREDEDIGDEELVGEGTDDSDEVDEEDGDTNAISWVKDLWNMKNTKETLSSTKLRKNPEADNDFEMKHESEERMLSSEVDKSSADVNVSSETELGTEQGESSLVQGEREPFPETLLPYAESNSYIPRAYLGAAFDKNCFQCCIRVFPVEYENLTEEQMRPLLKFADSVVMKVGPQDSPRVLELFCQDLSPLLPNLLFTPLGGDDINFEVERRQVTGQTEAEFRGKKIAVPTSFDTSEAPLKVTFTLKQDFFQKHLDLEKNKRLPNRLYRGQDVVHRSLIISDLPATCAKWDIGETLMSVFPLAWKAVIEESENQMSAMLVMKSRATVMRILMSVENVCIDGHPVQLGVGFLTQQKAIEKGRIKTEKRERTKLARRLKREKREQERSHQEQSAKEKTKLAKRLKREKREQEQSHQKQSANLLRDQIQERQWVQRERLNNNRSEQHSGNWSLGVRPTEPAQRKLSRMQDVTTGAERWDGHGQRGPGGPRRQPDKPTGQGGMTQHRVEQGCSSEVQQCQEELLREKERLEQMHREVVHKLNMVEERQPRKREELQQRQHDMEMENKHMQRFGTKRHMKQQKKEYWEHQSRKRSRFDPVEHKARNQQHGMPSKRGKGEEEPWEERQEGLRSESSAPGDLFQLKASTKRKLAMEVTRRAEELQRNLALLGQMSSDPAGAYDSFREFHRDQDTGLGGRPSTSFDRWQPTPDFETQQQQSYGKDFNQSTYGNSQGEDYSGQFQDYGEDLYDQDLSYSHWKPHGGGQTSTTGRSYDAGNGAQNQTGPQRTTGWGAGAKDTNSWQVSSSHGAGSYSQAYSQESGYNHRGHGTRAKEASSWQASGNHGKSEYSQSHPYSQTTGYDHRGQQKAGGYQEKGRQGGGYSSRPYDHAGNRGRGSSGQARNYRDRWFTNSNSHGDQDRRDLY